jgi:low temperature requirement protein LtrA
MTGGNHNLLRARGGEENKKVTFVELFFDLVFVFAVTQLSHSLAAHLTLAGVVQTTLLLVAMWWAWINTSWVTNWLDPEKTPVRLMLFGLMLAGLVLSTSIPQAFGPKALAFATAYACMQVGRCLFMLWALRGHSPANFRNFQRITAWLTLSSTFWIAGGFGDGSTRLSLWALALFLETLAPSVGFWTPGLGRSTTADWDVEGSHMAERCGLFVIIALGESILVSSAKFADLPWSAEIVAAFLVAFLGAVAMWWIYFNIGAETGSRRITDSSDPGRLARLAYTYMHLPLVAGIIVAAVGDELVLAHPTGHTDVKTAAVLLAGPALYLLGNLLFKRATANRPALSHIVGLALLAMLVPVTPGLQPLAFSALTTLVLVIVAVWETLSLRGAKTGERAVQVSTGERMSDNTPAG